MNSKTISLVAIALWVITISIIAFLFTKGKTETAADGRTAVILSSKEKILVLSEMRMMLGSVHGILEGLDADDMSKVESAALSGGTKMMIDLDPAFMMKLPVAFKQQGVGAHTKFDSIAQAAKSGKNKNELLKMLKDQMASCVQCHAAYQLKEE